MRFTTVDLREQRALTVLRDGSPNFYMTLGAINAGAFQYVLVEDQFPKARKYQPMMSIVITNNSGENVDLQINGQDYAKLPAGVIWTDTDSPVWSFKITNNDATNVAAGEISVNLSSPPMSQSEYTRYRTLYS
tara:strand:+ start:182 stop:580 length:399 start_codon:yes stop_codon:yes gene_type:complete